MSDSFIFPLRHPSLAQPNISTEGDLYAQVVVSGLSLFETLDSGKKSTPVDMQFTQTKDIVQTSLCNAKEVEKGEK